MNVRDLKSWGDIARLAECQTSEENAKQLLTPY